MIEQRARGHVERYLDPIGRVLVAAGFTPMAVTIVGLSLVVGGSVVVGFSHFVLGASMALLGSALDGLDGTVARLSGKASKRGAFLDSVSDRLGETAMWAGLAFAVSHNALATSDNAVLALLCVLNLGASLLVSYLRARAESVGADGRGGLMGRAERVILYTAGLAFNFVPVMLWVMAALTWMTVAQRFALVWQRLEG
ncbi:MAG: CDP-alcohol phosphatidyltransferase family protein [Acidimicrobiia bacterium]|nr:CDP-alcohol phosphatidyltransferase family protein [Acidimicrobiia bacterium]